MVDYERPTERVSLSNYSHQPAIGVFLGFDHAKFWVNNPKQCAAFYVDRLGFEYFAYKVKESLTIRDLNADLENGLAMLSETVKQFSCSRLLTALTKSSSNTCPSTETESETSHLRLRMPEGSTKRVLQGVPNQWKSLRRSKMIMVLLSLPQFRPMEILAILWLRERTIRDFSCQDSESITRRTHSESCLEHPLLKQLITVLEINLISKWNLLLHGTRRCSTSTDSGQLMTPWCTLNIQLWDLLSWQILTKSLKCQLTNQLQEKEKVRFKNLSTTLEDQEFNTLPSESKTSSKQSPSWRKEAVNSLISLKPTTRTWEKDSQTLQSASKKTSTQSRNLRSWLTMTIRATSCSFSLSLARTDQHSSLRSSRGLIIKVSELETSRLFSKASKWNKRKEEIFEISY